MAGAIRPGRVVLRVTIANLPGRRRRDYSFSIVTLCSADCVLDVEYVNLRTIHWLPDVRKNFLDKVLLQIVEFKMLSNELLMWS